MTDPVLFALAVLAILSMPGPTNTLLATTGAASGITRALPLIPAEIGGYLIAISAIGLVLGPAIAASPLLGLALRLAVGLYLLATAWALWHRTGSSAADIGRVVTPGRVFLTTLLNPKAILFALGVVPFGAEGVWLYLAGFAGLCALVALGWIAVGALAGRAATASGRGHVIPRIGAAAVAGFAALLLVSPLLR